MSSFASMLARLHRGGHARIHPNSLAATPLPPCSCTRFALLSSHHREFHTFHSKRNGQFNLVQQTFCVPRTQGLKGGPPPEGQGGGRWSEKGARPHPCPGVRLGTVAAQDWLTRVARVGGVEGGHLALHELSCKHNTLWGCARANQNRSCAKKKSRLGCSSRFCQE